MCDLIYGFHINSNSVIDSGYGIPQGQKLQLKTNFTIDNPLGGTIKVEYKLANFDPQGMEEFRISIDGQRFLDGAKSTSDGYTTYQSQFISEGTHILDIALLSNFEEHIPSFKSKARVLIKHISISGSDLGGAQDCLKCHPGLVSDALSDFCS